jgi:hypothetical protein
MSTICETVSMLEIWPYHYQGTTLLGTYVYHTTYAV